MSVTANGSLIIRSAQTGCPDVGLHVVSKYNANGSLEQDIKLSPDTNALIFTNAIQKPNGNLVLACVSNEYEHKELGLLEIDTGGGVVRQYQSSMHIWNYVNSADVHGRIMITDQFRGIELLDSELIHLGTHSLLENGPQYVLNDLCYNSERNEIVCRPYSL